MSLHHLRSLACLLFFATLSSYGCVDNGTTSVRANGVGPSLLTPTAVHVARGAMVQPRVLNRVPVAGAVCPAIAPFIAPFSVVFDGDGRSGLFLSGLHLQFIDRTGIVGGSMTLRRTDLVSRFGSTALPVSGTRAFPFSFPLGCVGVPTGTLTVIVFAADSLGRETSTRVRVTIR